MDEFYSTEQVIEYVPYEESNLSLNLNSMQPCYNYTSYGPDIEDDFDSKRYKLEEEILNLNLSL